MPIGKWQAQDNSSSTPGGGGGEHGKGVKGDKEQAGRLSLLLLLFLLMDVRSAQPKLQLLHIC